VAEIVKTLPTGTPVEIWFQDEMRLGQKNGLVYQWARKGTRPSQPADQRYESAYLFGALCPARDTGAALAMPFANTEAMQKHLDEIARTVMKGAHAIVLLDQAGGHTTDKLKTPKNLTLLPIPPASPELNAAENIWQYLRHFRTAFSKATTKSSRPVAKRGAGSRPAASDQSLPAAGHAPVRINEGWYN
jgi:hypothetical protein